MRRGEVREAALAASGFRAPLTTLICETRADARSMKTVTLLQPPRVAFGNGCATQCAELLTARGMRRVLLVTSTPIETGFLTEALTRNGCEVVRSLPVDREPTIEMFEGALASARSEKVDTVLGVGGGSAMDMAKLLAALLPGTQRIQDVFGINLLDGRGLFLVCLPTTSGTGSEVSPNAILLDESDQLKKGVVSPHLVPDAAFIDPPNCHPRTPKPAAMPTATSIRWIDLRRDLVFIVASSDPEAVKLGWISDGVLARALACAAWSERTTQHGPRGCPATCGASRSPSRTRSLRRRPEPPPSQWPSLRSDS